MPWRFPSSAGSSPPSRCWAASLPLPGAFTVASDALLGAAHAVFAVLADWLDVVASLPGAARAVATPPWPVTALALVGIGWLLAPPGWPVRWVGLMLVAPLFAWPAERPRGELWVTALDVGQGSAILLETRDRAWLYDTGPRYSSDSDAGERIVLPYLRHRGIASLDGLLVSHLDADHSGGTAAVLRGLPVTRTISSIPAAHPMFGGQPVERCTAGAQWVDGPLGFTVLHPPVEDYERRRTTNAMSCAILVTHGAHRLLLTGDIGVVEEAAILMRWPGLTAGWLAAPHHGSRSSSSALLLAAIGARDAVAQAGYRNRYGHPDPGVMRAMLTTGLRCTVPTAPAHCNGACSRMARPGAVHGAPSACATGTTGHRFGSNPMRARTTAGTPQWNRSLASLSSPDDVTASWSACC